MASNTIFIDTWAWLVYADVSDKWHKEVKEIFMPKTDKKKTFYTSNFILDEAFTLIFSRLKTSTAFKALDLIIESTRENISVVKIDEKYFNEAISLRKKYKDKPGISFTDLTSIAVIKDLQIKEVLSADNHFLQVGLDINLVP